MTATTTEPIPGRQARPSLLDRYVEKRWDEAAKQAVVGGVLLLADTVDPVLAILDPSDFYLPHPQAILATVRDLRNRGMPIDPITVGDALADEAGMADPRRMAYLFSLPNLSVPAANAPHHARIATNVGRRALTSITILP